MKTLTLFIFISLLSSCCPVNCQIWPKVYLNNQGTSPFSIIESYDYGYLIGGWFVTSDGYPINGLLLKTNINGDLLWQKRLGEYNDGTGVFDINQTSDHGVIISGSTEQTDSWGDPFVMKLNSCAESEWCRIFSLCKDTGDIAQSTFEIPGGYISFIRRLGYLYANDHIHLFRLDLNGNILWRQQYALSDSLFVGAAGEHMRVTSDYHYLINGYCYYPDSGTTNPKYLRPLIIKVDSMGAVDWERPWSQVNGATFRGESYRSILDNQHNIYSCGRHIESSATPPGDRPTMLKTDINGDEVSYHDLIPDTWQAVFYNINWFQDSTIEIDGGWIFHSGGTGQVGVLKLDKNGNILDSANIMQSVYCFSDAIVDKDNKVVLLQPLHDGNQWRTYLWKLNSDLEYDTLYNQPFVYDSLCPHPIASDTIPLDCVVVGLNEPFENPETGRLKVWPNPASDILHIEIPQQLKSVTQSPVFNLTTVYHQWRSAMLEVYDLFGKKVYSGEVRQPEKLIDLEVAGWSRGMYVVRLVYNGKTVASEKVLIK